MAHIRFGITIEEKLLAEIEERRGLIPRATYIEDCLRKYLKFNQKKDVKQER
jgi:metal-responsive CopG/Arc/MetJ family transcriptional regulator